MLHNLNPNFPDPIQFAGFLMWKKASTWEKFVNSQLKTDGLNQAEYFHLVSLFILLQAKPEITQTELANYTGATMMNCSKILGKCETGGLITRQTGRDSRSKSVHLTDAGQQVLRRTALKMHEADQQFFPTKNKTKFKEYLSQI